MGAAVTQDSSVRAQWASIARELADDPAVGASIVAGTGDGGDSVAAFDAEALGDLLGAVLARYLAGRSQAETAVLLTSAVAHGIWVAAPADPVWGLLFRAAQLAAARDASVGTDELGFGRMLGS